MKSENWDTQKQIETTLTPLQLLAVLKRIEAELGRDFSTFRNGPRVIDLDLLLYDNLVFDSRDQQQQRDENKDSEGERWLKVPHQSIQEREFVLKPLVEYVIALRPFCIFLTTRRNDPRPNTDASVLRQFPQPRSDARAPRLRQIDRSAPRRPRCVSDVPLDGSSRIPSLPISSPPLFAGFVVVARRTSTGCRRNEEELEA